MTQPTSSQGGAAPYGYRWHNGRLEIDEKEAPVRRLIFDLFLKHRRKKTVAKMLNELGYRTRKGAAFSDVAIDRLLRDTHAKGVRRELDLEIPVEAIVSNDVWERANSLLSRRELKHPAHIFAGRVKCSCGASMNVPSSSNKYVCAECRFKIPAEDLEEIFVSQLGTFYIGSTPISESWSSFTTREKSLVVEQLCDDIKVARESISIRFACDPSLFKTPSLEQHTEPVDSCGSAERENSPTAEPRIDEPLLGEAEAAKFLGISKMTLLRKRNAGLVGFFKVGFRVLYSKENHLVPYLIACERKRSA